MDLFAIHRRQLCPVDDLAAVDQRSQAELDRRDDVRKIRSYVFPDGDGTMGTICMYEAADEDAIRRHGAAADVAITSIDRVTAIDVQRPDPELAAS